MTETRTAVFGLPRYSSGADEVLTRGDWEEAAGNLEARAAYDDGTTGSALPTTKKAGSYFRRSFSDGWALHRQQGSTWEWVGGTVQDVRVRMRGALAGDILLSSDVAGGAASATWKAGGEIATSGLLRSSAGLGVGAPLDHDLSTPGTTGRAYVRTVNNGDRALVLQAHDDAAGALLTARTVGGSDPLTVDSRGRLRVSAPVGFGQSSPAVNIPLAVSPSGTDVTALDLYAEATGPVPGLRIFRDNSDAATPIVSVLSDQITLGRASWAGGAIDLVAPSIEFAGAVGVIGSLGVSDDLAVADTFTAEGAKVTSFESGSDFGFRSQLVVNGGGIVTRDLRHSMVWRQRLLNINKTVSFTVAADIHSFSFTPRTTCYPEVSLGTHWEVFDPGSAATDVEPNTVMFRMRILNEDGSSVLWTGDEIYILTLDAYDPHNYVGKGQISVLDCPPLVLNAGTTYKIQLWGRRDGATSISLVLKHVLGTIREGALLG